MISSASAFLPSRFRGEQPAAQAAAPSWLNKKLTPLLQLLSSLTSSHPIHTVVIVAVLASSTYMGLLEESIFDASRSVRRADWSSLSEGSRSLRVSADTAWKWQPWDVDAARVPKTADHLALLTFVFPESSSDSAPKTAPLVDSVPIPANISVSALPSTANPLGAYSQDTSLAFAAAYDDAAQFTSAAREIPLHEAADSIADQQQHTDDASATRVTEEHGREKKMWIMKAAGAAQTGSSILRWLQNGWVEFVDLLKNADTLDIIIMVLGYLSMHLTFVSLFLSMRRLGSNFWLGTSVLFSSTFAFLFGLIVTTKLGVPVSMVLLSEGLPFLVVTIGFEKNIALTKAVLSHALERRRNLERPAAAAAASGSSKKSSARAAAASAKKVTTTSSPSVIQYAIQMAIKEKGYDIVRDYAIEILILVIGAASGVQGGLQQFCFLAAWILVFDCVLLFTFYSAILCIKLEINRIKRHVELRRALEDDGVSRRVAENVAQSNDGFRTDGRGEPTASIFGRQIKSTSVPKFKVLMVTGFVIINVLNLCTLPFRSVDSLASISSMTGGLGGVVASPPVDPFKVAASGLDTILASAKAQNRDTVVTILTPIKYELEFPSVHYALPTGSRSGSHGASSSATGYAASDLTYGGVGGRMVDSILKSLEDPVLSKWIIVALALSVVLNGYLFNVARWGIKDPNVPDHPIDPRELAQAQKFNDTASATLPMGEYMPPTPIGNKPMTPALTDDEGELLAMRPLKQREGAPKPSPSQADLQAAKAKAALIQRTPAEMEQMLKDQRAQELTDGELVYLSLRGKIPGYALEKTLKDYTRAVKIRRHTIARTKATEELTGLLDESELPFENYNWDQVFGQCCENVVGYMPIPVGVAGPIVIDGKSYFIPMATTEGVLVASTSRGCKAINAGGGAVTVLTADGMTRGPCLSFETVERAGAAKIWLDSEAGQNTMRKAFNSTSRFARLSHMKTALAGTNLYVRFKTTTGDAMGMNMISKGVEHALNVMMNEAGFEDMNIVSLSGNYCIDKKAAALNWIDGRGKSVVAEAIIPGDVVRNVLKTEVDTLVDLNISKNLIGSAMAGAIGGFNAHAANIVAAIYIATGQDPAQVVESANCITIMKNLRGNLQISVSMPSIEVGTIGGGTILEPQGAMLDLLGVRGPHPTSPGENARRLARIIAAATLAGELSLCSALAAGHLVRAHMAHNRSAPPTRTTTPAPPTPSGALTPVTGLTPVVPGGAAAAGVERSASTAALSPAAVERSRR
ncbi:hydroxymethylglutaryl-CoA reductase (NADPH) [Sporothrix schenckii 1099-18]|uniref:3-hydroxy-3-methylglutaryl coenzyme A reductase n=2 Tax=Sporothrix schenckii TaxID=29908 RepID=U7PPS5_SPOS1|nr:hydroxymethylglutaryl-CoA reductase (NADPH) [Sporothrix schenckii 1099-18]ERS96480.1 hydroxymethylglutaryl-CoA reductase (NADPH) [Sporothrix schenckii ATCC 58251]KJR87220.1 hydroxymethylglutaryl-CoA reductase (NADPH) [Sporothrix schenckii 1099-18]